MERIYEVVLEPADEGGFAVFVPGMRGCVSQGETEEEALENIRDAIQCWLDSWDEVEAERASGSQRRTVVVSR